MPLPPKPRRRWPRSSLAAICGVVILWSGIFLAAIFHGGVGQEAYSGLNHFVSELGWEKKSPWAWAFNTGLIAVGILQWPLLRTMGRHVGSRLGHVAMRFGFVAALSASLVGATPMDRLAAHLVAAMVCFWSLLFSQGLFALALGLSPHRRSAKWAILTGALGCIVCVAFIAWPKQDVILAIHNLSAYHRPRIWPVVLLEWGVLVTNGLWIVTTAKYLRDEAG